jgi:hypothetical protein
MTARSLVASSAGGAGFDELTSTKAVMDLAAGAIHAAFSERRRSRSARHVFYRSSVCGWYSAYVLQVIAAGC